MSERISKGDLCVVVGPLPCCGWAGWIGKHVVAESPPNLEDVWCPFCLEVHSVEIVHIQGKPGISYPRSGLRRIPPLAEPTAADVSDTVPA